MISQKLDTDLISNVLKGDRSAQFQLFEMTKGMLFSICYRVANDKDEANDVLQDSYVEIFQKMHTLNHPEEFKPNLDKNERIYSSHWNRYAPLPTGNSPGNRKQTIWQSPGKT